MDVRLFLRMFLCSGLLLSASCTSNDLGPARPGDGHSTDHDDEDDEDEEGTTGKKDAGKKDAGKKDAGRKDAGRKDAGSADDEEAEDEEEEPVDEGEEPVAPAPRPTTPIRDAGRVSAPQPTTRSDAGAPLPPPPPPPTEPEPGEIGATPGGNGSTPTSGCSDVTYEGFVQPLFARTCVGCHSATSATRQDLTNVDSVSRLRDDIRVRINGTNPSVPSMPPGGKLPESDIAQLGMWFDCLP